MTVPWLVVVGIGADGLGGLGAGARAALAAAELVVGGERHLAMLPEDDHRPRLAWLSPLALTMDKLESWRGRRVVVLASGDPLWFGVARLLLRRFPAEEAAVLPHASAFQLAAARLLWPLETVTAISLHGRSLHQLHRWLQPGRRLLALSSGRTTPAEVAVALVRAGHGPSRLVVLEELGGRLERITEATAEGLLGPTAAAIVVSPPDAITEGTECPVVAGEEGFADLNLLAIEPRPTIGTEPLPLLPGLPDAAFEHDGQITKAEIRSITLAALAPMPGRHLWDIGAGAGSVALEWLRSGPAMRATAIECNRGRVARIWANAARLGAVEGLAVEAAQAPACLAGLQPPDAVFIGGGVADPGLLDAAWQALPPGGRLVANAVTLAGEAALLALRARLGGRLIRIGLSRAEPVGSELAWRPALPVTQYMVKKPCDAAS